MHSRPYSIGEMTYMVFPAIRDLITNTGLSESHRDDVGNAHPWLLSLTTALNQTENWKVLTEYGRPTARFFGTVGEATILIEYSGEAITRGLCRDLPYRFCFTVKGGRFVWRDTKTHA